MVTLAPQVRFHAVSLALVARPDNRLVDMLVSTEDGTAVTVECGTGALSELQRQLARIALERPEIATDRNLSDLNCPIGTDYAHGGFS